MAAVEVCLRQTVPPISQSSSILSEQDVLDILRRKLSDDFHIINWQVEALDKTKGFLGQYYHLTIVASTRGIVQQYKFFVKVQASVNNPLYEFAHRNGVFSKEVDMYNKVIPAMGVGKGPKWTAECYLARENDIVVLQDMSVEGFAVRDKYDLFDRDHCSVFLKSLAKFHSRSFVLEEKLRRKNSSIIELYEDNLRENLFPLGDSDRLLRGCIKGAKSMVDLTEELNDEERGKLKERVGKWMWRLPRLLVSSTRHRNVICHRDIWNNNLMFKYGPRGKPECCCLVDFQFVRYCPPAIDFLNAIYLSTNRLARKKHFESYARMYHDYLTESLEEEGLDVEEWLSWTSFRESCEDIRPIGLVWLLLLLPMILLDSRTIEKNCVTSFEIIDKIMYENRYQLFRQEFMNNAVYRERIVDAVLDVNESLPDELPDFCKEE